MNYRIETDLQCQGCRSIGATESDFGSIGLVERLLPVGIAVELSSTSAAG